MKDALTERQQSIYEYIEEYQLEHGYSPKILDIQQAFGIKSVNGVVKHLRALEKKGWIERDNTPRGIKLLERALEKLNTSLVSVPIFGTIPAGNTQQIDEYVEGYYSMDQAVLGNNTKVFALRVQGESMIDAGIYDGDLVFVAQKEPRTGDIVAALFDGESTLKRFQKDANGNPYLKAENAAYPEMHPAHALEIQGVVVQLVRNY